jgi:hypothetical protein
MQIGLRETLEDFIRNRIVRKDNTIAGALADAAIGLGMDFLISRIPESCPPLEWSQKNCQSSQLLKVPSINSPQGMHTCY